MFLQRHKLEIILLFFAVSWMQVSSDIYKSVFWTTNNPFFSNYSHINKKCFGEDLEMRVHLKSILPIVCPFEFIIMQTLPSRPATGVLYENFWIVYDKKSFDTCNIDLTIKTDGERNKKLHDCDTPDTLKSFTYTVDFKEKSPVNYGISFRSGKYYYFLATSDGTDGSLNNTKGGHCNDTKVRMKFKVYICKDNDVKCSNPGNIGVLLCPSDLASETTTATSTIITPSDTITPTTTIAPTITITPTTTAPSTTIAPSIQTNTTINQSEPPSTTTTQASGNDYSTSDTPTVKEPKHAVRTSNNILDDLAMWRTIAVVLFCLLVVLIVAILIRCYIIRRREKDGLRVCFTDLNRVDSKTEKEDEESLDQMYRNSHNNFSYHEDSEDGKSSKMFPLETKSSTAPSQTEGGQNGDHSTKKSAVPQKNEVQSDTEDGQNGDLKSSSNPSTETPTKPSLNGLIINTDGGEKKDASQNEKPIIPNTEVKTEKIGNGIPNGKESGERSDKHKHRRKNKHKEKAENPPTSLRDAPRRLDPIIFQRYSSSTDDKNHTISQINGNVKSFEDIVV